MMKKKAILASVGVVGIVGATIHEEPKPVESKPTVAIIKEITKPALETVTVIEEVEAESLIVQDEAPLPPVVPIIETTKEPETEYEPTIVKVNQAPIKTVQPKPKAVFVEPTPVFTPPAPKSNCDPNYSDCVPIDSDVDCAGGSGNGPSYAEGPVQVLGRDIYGLDRDKDGWGCE